MSLVNETAASALIAPLSIAACSDVVERDDVPIAGAKSGGATITHAGSAATLLAVQTDRAETGPSETSSHQLSLLAQFRERSSAGDGLVVAAAAQHQQPAFDVRAQLPEIHRVVEEVSR